MYYQQKTTSPYSFGDKEDTGHYSTKSSHKINNRKLKKITRDREDYSDDTEPEFISVFVEKELNIPTEDSNTEEALPNSENFSLNFYSKRAKSTSPLSSPKYKKDNKRILHSPHNYVSSFKEDRGLNTCANSKFLVNCSDLQAYMNFKGKHLPDIMLRDLRGIKGLLRETGSPKEMQLVPKPILNDIKLMNLEKIYGGGIDDMLKKKREKIPPDFRIRKQKNNSGSDSGGESPKDTSKVLKDLALPPIQVKNKNENFMFNINFIVNNQKELPSPQFQRTAYREDPALQKTQFHKLGTNGMNGNAKIGTNKNDKTIREEEFEKVHTPTFYNFYKDNGAWSNKQEDNSQARAGKDGENLKNKKKLYDLGQKVDTKDSIELKESITKFYKKINNDRDQFMQANRALASRLGVRENRSKSPPLLTQNRPKVEGFKLSPEGQKG